ncbi:aspartate aminotransferase family protein, partial [Pseudomonas sp. MWU12-2534b]
KIVLQYWKSLGRPSKTFFVARRNGYHGSTIGAASLGGMDHMHSQIPCRLANVLHVGQPYWFGESHDLSPDEFGLVRAREIEAAILEAGPENVAAVFGEPFQGAGGVIIPPATYWPEVQRICRKYDVLLCADEVIGGFGRTGHWFASELFGIEPDVVTFAKGLTSGYVPMGGAGVSSRIAEALETGGEFHHGMTYSGHPVCAAVAIASMELIRRE